MRAIKDFIYSIVETLGSKMHTWAWNKRWCNKETGTGYKK